MFLFERLGEGDERWDERESESELERELLFDSSFMAHAGPGRNQEFDPDLLSHLRYAHCLPGSALARSWNKNLALDIESQALRGGRPHDAHLPFHSTSDTHTTTYNFNLF